MFIFQAWTTAAINIILSWSSDRPTVISRVRERLFDHESCSCGMGAPRGGRGIMEVSPRMTMRSWMALCSFQRYLGHGLAPLFLPISVAAACL